MTAEEDRDAIDHREALAGEYVLGTLDAREAAAVTAALESDDALREAVARWEAQLAPLMTLAPPEAPPPALWSRIEASLAPPAPVAGVTRERFSWLWRGWAIGASALAASLAVFMVMRPAEPPRLMTVLLTQQDQPAWMVEANGNAIRLAALNPRPLEAGRVLQLWALPQGATTPTSLGLIPADGRFSVTPSGIVPQAGMLVEISLEPPGGSPLPRPSGPVLFIGRLTAAGAT